MSKLMLIAVGGACGTVLRYQVGQMVSSRWPSDVPWGTFSINLIGSFLLGYLTGKMGTVWLKGAGLGLLLGTGVLGGFTTFSTLCFESLKLIQTERYLTGLGYLAGSSIFGMLTAYVGLHIASL